MSKAEKFIKDCTKGYSNELVLPDLEWNNTHKEYNPWLTPDQARRAVELAREEMYEWLEENAYKYSTVGLYTDAMINDLKQAMR